MAVHHRRAPITKTGLPTRPTPGSANSGGETTTNGVPTAVCSTAHRWSSQRQPRAYTEMERGKDLKCRPLAPHPIPAMPHPAGRRKRGESLIIPGVKLGGRPQIGTRNTLASCVGGHFVAQQFGYAVLLDLVQQRLIADLEPSGSLLAVPVGLLQGAGNGLGLCFVFGATRQGLQPAAGVG